MANLRLTPDEIRAIHLDVTSGRAEDLGYVRYRCPRCKRTFYDDAGPECPSCGMNSDESEDAVIGREGGVAR